MKKISVVVLFFCGLNSVFAQTELNEHTVILSKFDRYYNAGQIDSVFALFSPQTKINLPLIKTNQFLSQLKGAYGRLINRKFLAYQNGYGVYETDFEKGKVVLSIAIDNNKEIVGLFAKPAEQIQQAKMLRNLTTMKLPFKGEWTVFWGGDTKEQNYHVAVGFQKNAFDIVINKDGKSYQNEGKVNEDYYAYAQPLYAPCDAEVILAVDGIKDNIPGISNPIFLTGNTVVLKTKNNEYILLAHFKQGTIKVKQGDKVKAEQLLGLCGNSGNSSEPHIHFHLQDREDFTKAIGIKCYFDELKVNGLNKKDYSPVKGDRIQP